MGLLLCRWMRRYRALVIPSSGLTRIPGAMSERASWPHCTSVCSDTMLLSNDISRHRRESEMMIPHSLCLPMHTNGIQATQNLVPLVSWKRSFSCCVAVLFLASGDSYIQFPA